MQPPQSWQDGCGVGFKDAVEVYNARLLPRAVLRDVLSDLPPVGNYQLVEKVAYGSPALHPLQVGTWHVHVLGQCTYLSHYFGLATLHIGC